MKKLYVNMIAVFAFTGLRAQEVLWQKDITSSTQDFLSQVITTIDGQYLVSGSSIQPSRAAGNIPSRGSGTVPSTGSKMGQQPAADSHQQNAGYDFHLVKLNQQGEQTWEKFFTGKKP